MSLYHLMTGGPHPLAAVWLCVLNFDPASLKRLRNVYIVRDESRPEPLSIYILTRDADNAALHTHPALIREDVAFPGDNYHEWEFSIPPAILEDVRGLCPNAILPRYADHHAQIVQRISERLSPHPDLAPYDREAVQQHIESILTWCEKEHATPEE